ncbi:hypothetical protein GCM10025871_05550 [Deinococcus metallilatus]|nr:hypothetical protein GCM10025871_05550 [Deinococcus metallilatus]
MPGARSVGEWVPQLAKKTISKGKRRWVRTTDSTHTFPVWASGLTYLPTREGWLYLAANLPLTAFRMAATGPPAPQRPGQAYSLGGRSYSFKPRMSPPSEKPRNSLKPRWR